MNAGEKRLERAKLAVSKLKLSDGGDRKWLTTELKSYGNMMYYTRLHVLEGSPPRAYILENPDFNVCVVLDSTGGILGEARDGLNAPVRWVPRAKRAR